MRSKTTTGMRSWITAARWTASEARSALTELEESGEPVMRFAARNGIDAQRFYQWRRRLSLAPATPGFVEVEQSAVEQATRASVIEVVLTSGEVLRVPPIFDDAALARVLAVVRGTRQC